MIEGYMFAVWANMIMLDIRRDVAHGKPRSTFLKRGVDLNI